MDPLRPEIVESIETCRRAGTTVLMCTGDNIETAKAIAKDAKIISDDFQSINNDKNYQKYVCMTGQQFREEIGGLTRIPDPKYSNFDLEGDDHAAGHNTIEVL